MVGDESTSSVNGADVGLRTYKRRKVAKGVSGSTESARQLPKQTVLESEDRILHKSSCEQFNLFRQNCNVTTNGHKHCPIEYWRNIVLQRMCESLSKGDDGFVGSIHDAVVYYPEIDPVKDVKDSIHCHGDKVSCLAQKEWIPLGTQNAAEGHPCVVPNGTSDESNHPTITKMCMRAFFNVIISEKFASLCKLLLENFQGIKLDGFFDLSLINSRVKDGTYERSPMLFFSDIQQVWGKLEKIGFEMLSFAKSLSEISRVSCHDWVRDLADGSSVDGGHKVCTPESDRHEKLEQAGTSVVSGVRTCRICRDKADEKDCLVCDSCEEMYHIGCIKPAVIDIPPRSWYCANCTAKGIRSPHENCVVCDRRNAPKDLINEVGNNLVLMEELNEPENSTVLIELENGKVPIEDPNEREKSTNPSMKEEPSSCHCIICDCAIENEEFCRCEHPYCFNKYYHVRCLSAKQLKSYGPRWYCPSCLCRVCLVDRHDHLIVICDGCNQAYHIYCMDPPLHNIPGGKWFCKTCCAMIQSISKAKWTYGRLENEERKEAGGEPASGNMVGRQANNKGMNILLSAVETLNCEDCHPSE